MTDITVESINPDDPWAPAAPRALEDTTIVHDLGRNESLMRIAGHVVLPIGSQVELSGPDAVRQNISVPVESVRLLSGPAGSAVTICLDVTVPDDWYDN